MSEEEPQNDAHWVRYIKTRIGNNKNFLGLISGPTGSGKSWSALSIAEQIDKDFTIDRVIFKGKDLMALINSGTLIKGSVIIWEEVGIELSNRNWQSTINKVLNYLLQTVRHKNYILLFTTPYADFVDASTRKLFHAEFKTLTIDKSTNSVILDPKTLQYNSDMGKTYRKFLRVRVERSVVPLIEWAVPKPSDKIITEYEKKKSDFTSNLNKNIEKALDKLEKADKDEDSGENSGETVWIRPLTPFQEQIYGKIKEGIRNMSEIARLLNTSPQRVQQNIAFMIRKGFKY